MLTVYFSPGETCDSRNGRVGKFNFRKHWKSSPTWIPWMKITMVVKSECPSLNITLLWKKGTLWSVQCFFEGCYWKLCSEKKDILLMEEILDQLICSFSQYLHRIHFPYHASMASKAQKIRFRMCFQKSKVPLNFWGAKWDHPFPFEAEKIGHTWGMGSQDL